MGTVRFGWSHAAAALVAAAQVGTLAFVTEGCSPPGGGASPDAGSGNPAPMADSGSPAPVVDSGSPAPVVDSGSPAPVVDSGSPAPVVDSGSPAPDASTVPADAGAPPVADAGVVLLEEITATTGSMNGPGLDDCGPANNEPCARSLVVPGATFFRGTPSTAHPATVSDFRLDKYEVTVGRFRKFVWAWVAGWRPQPGSGKHAHLNGTAGVRNPAGGFEAGWDAAWSNYVGAWSAFSDAPTDPPAATKALWDYNLQYCGLFTTWTSNVGPREKHPMNCLSWYDLQAFCVWDGGFLPTEAEWELAAAGGNAARRYPWGNFDPGPNPTLAIHGCFWNGAGPTCQDARHLAPVGSAPAGAGRWGHMDLAGNVGEWVLDRGDAAYTTPCADCATLAGSRRQRRGGAYEEPAEFLLASARYGEFHAGFRTSVAAGRCARKP